MNWLRKIAGNPYNGKLYHGSNKSFGSFDLSLAGLRDWGDYGIGVYLSLRPTMARMYAQDASQNGGTSVIHVVQANLNNVASGEELRAVIEGLSLPYDKELTPGAVQTRPELDSRNIASEMIKNGFDAALCDRGLGVSPIEIVVYDPGSLEIIRSVSVEESEYLV